MRILVLSDSHSVLRTMRAYVTKVQPDAIIHLGDYYADGQVLAEENPHLVVHQVPGNCDLYRVPGSVAMTLCYPVGGVKLYMTHGHMQHVKLGLGRLLQDAQEAHAQAVLFGHTHEPLCRQEPDGLWVLNPGSCGFAGTAGLIETKDGSIIRCAILTREDLEEKP